MIQICLSDHSKRCIPAEVKLPLGVNVRGPMRREICWSIKCRGEIAVHTKEHDILRLAKPWIYQRWIQVDGSVRIMNGYKIISGEQWCLHAFDVISSSGIGGDGPQSTFWQDGGAVGMLFRSEVHRLENEFNEFKLRLS